MKTQRSYIPWIDVVRTMAILGVILCHVVDTVMTAPQAAGSEEYTLWTELYKTLSRPSVSLFVLITGYLLLPVKMDSVEFYKKRLTRILYPFLFWSVAYTMLPWVIHLFTQSHDLIRMFFPYYGSQEPTLSYTLMEVARIPLTFNGTSYPLWYVYMFVGLYFFMPVISPWLEKSNKKEKTIFLTIWGVSLFIPYIRAFVMNYAFGESEWNEFGLFYYFAGFIGYIVMGHWMKQSGRFPFQKKFWLTIPVFLLSYWITYEGYHFMMLDPNVTPEGMELFFLFCTPNVMLMTYALFVMASNVTIRSEAVNRVLSTLSRYGFGIYMVHYLLIGPIDYVLARMMVPVAVHIPLCTLLVFVASWMFVFVLGKLPKSKWLIG